MNTYFKTYLTLILLLFIQENETIIIRTVKNAFVYCSNTFTIQNTTSKLCAIFNELGRIDKYDYKTFKKHIKCPDGFELYSLLLLNGSHNYSFDCNNLFIAWIDAGYKSMIVYSNSTFKLHDDKLNLKNGLFICKKSSLINESCVYDNDCKDKANLVCSQGRCICNQFTENWSNAREKCLRYYGEEGCRLNSHCNKGLVCNITYGKYVCMCPYLNDSQQYYNTLKKKCSIPENSLMELNTKCLNDTDCQIKYGIYCINEYCQRPNEYKLPVSYCFNDSGCWINNCVNGVCVDLNHAEVNLTNYISSIDVLNRTVVTVFGTYKFSNDLVDYTTAKSECFKFNSTLFYAINQTEFNVIKAIIYQLEYYFWIGYELENISWTGYRTENSSYIPPDSYWYEKTNQSLCVHLHSEFPSKPLHNYDCLKKLHFICKL